MKVHSPPGRARGAARLYSCRMKLNAIPSVHGREWVEFLPDDRAQRG